MFTFPPKTEEEVTKSGLLEKGEYQFEVKSAQIKNSRSTGKPMVELVLIVWDKEGREHPVYDYLVDSVEFKIRHFCYSIGIGDKYEQGCFSPADCMGSTGICKVIIREDKTGQYPPKNSVVDYIVDPKKEKFEVKKNDEKFLDDDIPF